ncbi:MAG TPA: hypothetical protein VG273_13440 [Bryobacteraceae bacterium]|jgi:hypothetical protein|nr:hypothetical protein [Bryobacteraceae bacterium]
MTMPNNRFGNICLLAILCLLAVIAVELKTGHVYAAKTWQYSVVRVLDAQAPDAIQKQTQSGWELVSSSFWTFANQTGNAEGLLIFRK